MQSGILSRYKWVKNRVIAGEYVYDTDGKLFQVTAVEMVPDPSMELTTLRRVVESE